MKDVHVVQVGDLSFTFMLTFDDDSDDFGGVKLNRFALHEIIDNVAYFVLRPPQSASYRFIIYARDSHLDVNSSIHPFIH